MKINIIGGGLAGSEAAWQLLKRGAYVTLYEQRKGSKLTNAHKSDNLCELVCSNSFRNDDINSAIGLLHEEMRRLDSLIMRIASMCAVPAGSALAVDRDEFSSKVQEALLSHPNFKLVREEITELPLDSKEKWIIATGPLTSDALTTSLLKITGEENLAFFDAIAPIIYKESINFDIAWFQSRYDKKGPSGTGKDYINCPMNKEEYYNFLDALIAAEKTEFKEWEKEIKYFDGCLPIEVMAERGRDTLLFGPMKPVGLTNPNRDERPYAVVQLRQDNKLGTLYNIVGFQTKLKYAEQKRIFSMIPGLEVAEFARFGGIHRNSFINSPKLLNPDLSLKAAPHIYFAGQITGVEGYVESAACGLIASLFAFYDNLPPLSNETSIGALIDHITLGANAETFQPMNANFGLFKELDFKHKKGDRKSLYAKRAIDTITNWINELERK